MQTTKIKVTNKTAARILFALASCTALGFLFLSSDDVDIGTSQRQLKQAIGRQTWTEEFEGAHERLRADVKKENRQVRREQVLYRRLAQLEHEDDKLCIAVVNDENITTASVVDENGHFELALPVDYEATVTLECTQYARMNAATEQSSTGATYTKTIMVKQGGDHDPSGDCSKQLHLQPGYFDVHTNQWIDHCTGPARARPGSEFVKDLCPITRKKKKPWVVFVGDSVTRQWLFGLGIQLDHWYTGRNSKYADHMQGTLIKDDENEIWLSYAFNFLWENHNVEEKGKAFCWDLPITWGDFVKQRGEGHREGGVDPNYPDDKVPDIIFFGPGYHASQLTSNEYGLALDDTMTWWKDKINEVKLEDAPMPQMYILLNVMPAPWLIPQKFKDDRMFRTLLNEYRKNLAMIAVAHKHSLGALSVANGVDGSDSGNIAGESFVKSVVDLFSIELPFNGHEGASPHGDAVHLDEMRGGVDVIRAVGDRIIDTICYAEGDYEELVS